MECEHWNYTRHSKCPHKPITRVTFTYPMSLSGYGESREYRTTFLMCNGHTAISAMYSHRQGGNPIVDIERLQNG